MPTISLVYHIIVYSYEECKEFREDGTVNPEGKERRSQAKAIVLGVTYGKGIPAIGEDLGISTQKAQAVYAREVVIMGRDILRMKKLERMDM